MKQFDVVIAGGAMAGMTLALAINKLAAQPISVAVIEPFQVDHQQHPGFDSRSIALSFGTVAILKQFGLWQEIEKVATPIEDIYVSDRTHAGMTSISAGEAGVDALGFVVELADVGRIYHQYADQDPNITRLNASVEQVLRNTENVTLKLSDNSAAQAKLLVAADGALSTCCEQVGVALSEHDFQQVAIIANITTQQPHQGRAFERFTSSGPLALLPMSQGRMSLVWCVKPEQAEQISSYNDEQFLSELQQAFGWRLGKLHQVGQRASYPLLLRYREQNISHRFAVVGNAAQTLHPIAGQGFNLGIRDVATLAETIAASGDELGGYRQLAKFQHARSDDRAATIKMTSSLVHIFSNHYLPLRLGRNLGLLAMDNLAGLKAPLLSRALGLVAR